MTERPSNTTQLEDPRQDGATPPFNEQEQDLPGRERDMEPTADHGQESYIGTGRLAGLVALITGGDSGIGRAVALAYAREGADVLVSYLNEDEDARETCRLVEEAGRRAVAVAGDIGDEQQCQALVERAISEFGRLDVLVNNAAHQNRFESIADIATDEWRHTFATNIDAIFYLCRAAIPHMQAGASIINTSSVQAFTPSASLLPYATTKGAIVTFTKALAKMVGEQGIRVNAVCPGPVWTPLIPATTEGEQVAEFGQQSVFGRPAQPAELAGVFVFLASPEASYVSGSAYGVHGGMDMP
ncbi:MAG TPA: glucose 1-dehydrogenase [Candidatus Limnocylindrales bacterium]|nr:glucose 1-dehydrogenase [Candidatus Limnocylindrales bacterium]